MTVALQTLNVLRPSQDNILSVKFPMGSAEIVLGTGKKTQYAEKIKSAVFTTTRDQGALNVAGIIETAARGKMAKKYAI